MDAPAYKLCFLFSPPEARLENRGVGYAYPFSHNHGSVENHPKWKETTIGGTLFFDFHDYVRKCIGYRDFPF